MKKSWIKKQVVSQWPDIYQQMNDKLWLNNIKLEKQPSLTISEWCHKHIKELHKEYPKDEWLALCKIENRWGWEFYLVDMIHPWQTTSGWSVSTTDDWIDWAVKTLQERWEDMWLWNCVLHSHHSMWCFWSWTDDNARKDLNDWRFMAFAVVSSYRNNGTDMEIDYKGCVNFYKPYNIEIDCDMYYEEIDLDKNYLEYFTKYGQYKEEIFEAKLKDKQEEINWLIDQPDYTRVIDYLWLDIAPILEENYRDVVVKKMPNPQVDIIIKTCEIEAGKEAEEKLKEDWVLMDSMIEYEERYAWSNDLKAQLKENIKDRTKIQSRDSYNKITSQSNRVFSEDEDYYENYWYRFTSRRYPTVNEVRWALGLKPTVNVLLVNWIWKVYSQANWKYIYADDFDEELDWESCVWTEEELRNFVSDEEDKAEDVLHWLYN